MATWWIDYSAAKLTADVIKRTKIGPDGETASGAIRYVDAPDRLGRKHTNKAEYDDLVRGGLAMDAMFFEVDVDDPLGGYAQGQAFARRAKAGADYLGFGGVILFCADRWFVSKGRRTITADMWQAYLDGVVSILGRGRTGAYGFSDAMDAAVGHVDYFVQCGSRSVVRNFVNAWQDNNVQPVVGGIQTDRLLILKPFSTSVQEDDDMPTPEAFFWGTKFDGNDNFAQYLKGHVAKIEAGQAALLAAVAASTNDPAITEDTMRQIVNDAVAQHVVITGEVRIGPADSDAPAASQ
jgi:hypothetical protein